MKQKDKIDPPDYVRPPQILIYGEKHSKYIECIVNKLIEDLKNRGVKSKALESYRIQRVSSEWELIAFAEIVRFSDNAVLVLDSDGVSLAEAQKKIYDRIKFQADNVCAAVPSMASWLFSDIENAKKYSRNETALDVLRRISTPEEIAYPKQLAYNAFKVQNYEEIFSSMDIESACLSSQSFAHFINRIIDISKIPKEYKYLTAYNRSLDLDIIANLLREYSRENSTVYRSLDGKRYSAEYMIQAVSRETDIGKEYASNLLRIARDFIARKAIDD